MVFLPLPHKLPIPPSSNRDLHAPPAQLDPDMPVSGFSVAMNTTVEADGVPASVIVFEIVYKFDPDHHSPLHQPKDVGEGDVLLASIYEISLADRIPISGSGKRAADKKFFPFIGFRHRPRPPPEGLVSRTRRG